MSKLKTVGSPLLCLFGVLVLINAAIASACSNVSLGPILTYMFGGVLLTGGILTRTLCARRARVVFIVVLCILLLAVLCIGTVYTYGRLDSVTYDEDVLIVLGAGIRGEKISLTLQRRLDTALRYYEQNPDVLIVISGGQGPQEDISEALAMERYLLRHGVPKAHILKEELSTSTQENLQFSKALLDARLNTPYTVALITNDFHIYRACTLARAQGFAHITSAHADTPWYTVIPNGMRECLAIAASWLK